MNAPLPPLGPCIPASSVGPCYDPGWGRRAMSSYQDMLWLKQIVGCFTAEYLNSPAAAEALSEIVGPLVDTYLASPDGQTVIESTVESVLAQLGIVAGGSLTLPLRGLTDGSEPAAGNVGEVISDLFTGPIGSGAIGSTINIVVPTITLPPGDWDVSGICNVNLNCRAMAVTMSTPPAGYINALGVSFQLNEADVFQQGDFAMSRGRLNVVTSTQLVFTVQAVVDTTAVVNYRIGIWARRAR